MMALIPFLTGPLGKMAGIALAAALFVAGAAVLVHRHDAGIRQQEQAAAQAVAMDALNKQHIATVAAMEALTKAVQDRAVSSEQIRSVIHAASSSSACAGSPAMAAALDGLRQRLNAGSGPAGGPTKPVDVRR
jgi:hypothetical protein